MQALGMIEVYGYLAAVEALDSALKAAQVSLIDVVQVKGGLVTVLFSGDVGAVKASVDASKKAAKRVGQVVSVHVIPHPTEDLARMLIGESNLAKWAKGKEFPKNLPQENPELDTKDVVVEDKTIKKDSTKGVNDSGNGTSYSNEELSGMTVAQLRKVAREMGLDSMTREEIRFARKQDLIAAIIKWRQES